MSTPLATATALPSTLISILIRQAISTTPTPTSITSTNPTTTTSSASSTSSSAQVCTRCADFIVPIFFVSLVLVFIGICAFYVLFWVCLTLLQLIIWIFEKLFKRLEALWKWIERVYVKRRKEWGDWRVKKGKEKADRRDKRRKAKEEREAVELERKRGVVGVEAII
ncbi:hypothetical protein BDZ45DRAFT_803637 [Acephala macrosclerotiorum]|nr:hypothetical protein BDZ45DRAFT_803637 [Acephala macrosclerotiorum]